MRQRGAAHKHNAHQVGRENILPIFERAFGQCAPAKIAYVVDKNIESAKAIGHGIDELVRAFCSGDIRFNGNTVSAGCLQLAQGVLRHVLVGTIADGNAGALFRQAEGNSPADAARSPRNQRNPVA